MQPMDLYSHYSTSIESSTLPAYFFMRWASAKVLLLVKYKFLSQIQMSFASYCLLFFKMWFDL